MNSITIGVTGHRDIVITENLKDNIKGFFIGLKSKYIKLLSPLADGADRLVADIYLDVFRDKAHLAVPMPFNQKRYMDDFDRGSKDKFLNYLEVADEVFEVDNNQGCNYKSVGIYVADNSDILLALWDGTFNNKFGGTSDIIKYARDIEKKVIHIKCKREGN